VAFIAAQFAEHFRADVHDDTEEVYVVVGPDGRTEAAFGLNLNFGDFFSRHYVANMGDVLADRYAGTFTNDSSVVELAHLCVRNARAICQSVPILAEFLALNADFIVCTATRELASLFKRKGLAPDVMALASPQHLPVVQRGQWGSYYDHEPVVLSGYLPGVCARLRDAKRCPSNLSLREQAVA